MELSVFDVSVKGRRLSATVVPGKEYFFDRFVEYLEGKRIASFDQFRLTSDALFISNQTVRVISTAVILFNRHLKAKPIGISSDPYFYASFQDDPVGYFSRAHSSGIPLRFVQASYLGSSDVKEIVRSSIRCLVYSYFNDSGFIIQGVSDSDLIYTSTRGTGSSITISEITDLRSGSFDADCISAFLNDLAQLKLKYAKLGLIQENEFDLEFARWCEENPDRFGDFRAIVNPRLA